jgi:hypothetical protein
MRMGECERTLGVEGTRFLEGHPVITPLGFVPDSACLILCLPF